MATMLGKYFSLEEFIRSQKAIENNIDNSPNDEHYLNMIEFVRNILDPLREDWGQYCVENGIDDPGIRISSGYRSVNLNSNIKDSSNTSQHCHGQAADLQPLNGKIFEFKKFCFKWLYEKHYVANKAFFHQVISEGQYDSKIESKPNWIHIGARREGERNAGQFMYGKYVNGSMVVKSYSMSDVEKFINNVTINHMSEPSTDGPIPDYEAPDDNYDRFYEVSETINSTSSDSNNILRIDPSNNQNLFEY